LEVQHMFVPRGLVPLLMEEHLPTWSSSIKKICFFSFINLFINPSFILVWICIYIYIYI
jgi:hypothetical protein